MIVLLFAAVALWCGVFLLVLGVVLAVQSPFVGLPVLLLLAWSVWYPVHRMNGRERLRKGILRYKLERSLKERAVSPQDGSIYKPSPLFWDESERN